MRHAATVLPRALDDEKNWCPQKAMNVNKQIFNARDRTAITAPPGRPAFRRGMGLGGWLLPEGYMWGIHEHATSPMGMEGVISSLLGTERAEEFWRRYREIFITRADIAAIASAGFDHIRLPLNSRLIFDGDELIGEVIRHADSVIDWCRWEGLTCVLDLHGAPGGQTGANIDDSPRGLPELFTDADYFDAGVRLWGLLAKRYGKDPTVSCFDLLNEPLPDPHGRLVARLVDFYESASVAIRKAGAHQMLSYEGSHWATRAEMFDEGSLSRLDANSCIQFHKYWSEPTQDSIQELLDLRHTSGFPLWMGESGENEDHWYSEAFRLFEANEIPWTFWTWKKVEGPTSPVVVSAPRGGASSSLLRKGAVVLPRTRSRSSRTSSTRFRLTGAASRRTCSRPSPA